MGLIERRLIQQIKEVTANESETLNQKLGFDIPLTVDTASFLEDEQILTDFLMQQYYALTSLTNAIISITENEKGKEVVQEQIKKIVLLNTAKNYNDEGYKKIVLQNGELLVYGAFSGSCQNLFMVQELEEVITHLLN